MPRVVAIEEIPRKKNERRLRLDDGRAEVLLLDTIFAHFLGTGSELPEEKLAAVQRADKVERCRAGAWRLLESSPRTSKQMREALRVRRHPKDVIEEVVANLERLGHLDEKTFAKGVVESKGLRGGKGPLFVQQALRASGVSRGVADEAVEALRQGDTQRDMAQRVLEKWLRSHTKDDPSTRRRKAAEFLMRRGFESEIVWDLVRDAILDNRDHEF